MPWTRNTRFLISLVAIIVLACPAWEYRQVRSVEHHLPLVTLSLSLELNLLQRCFVNFEIRRRIDNGDFDGVMVLHDYQVAADAGADSALLRIDELLAGTVDINDYSRGGTTLLHQAVISNDAGAVRYWLDRGADPALKTRFSRDSDSPTEFDAVDYLAFAEQHFPNEDWREVAGLLGIEPETR